MNKAQNDMNEALANITGLGEDTRADIVNSVLAGNTVTTHSMPINMGNWRGFGYVVFNPQTFSSVYMIDGGPRGGSTGCDSDCLGLDSFFAQARYAGGAILCGLIILAIVFALIMYAVKNVMFAVAFFAFLKLIIDVVNALKSDNLSNEEKAMLIVLVVLFTAVAFLVGIFNPLVGLILGIFFAILLEVVIYLKTTRRLINYDDLQASIGSPRDILDSFIGSCVIYLTSPNSFILCFPDKYSLSNIRTSNQYA